MTILDRYILRLFTKVLVISFISLTGLFIIIDAFSNIDEFITYGEKQGGVLRVLVDYYGARVLMFFDRIVGILGLMAAVTAVTWLQRTNELTAIMAGGIPKFRVVRPLIIATIVVSIMGLANREFLIPSVRHKLTRNAQDWLGESAKALNPRYDNQTDILFSGRHTIAKEKKIDHPSFRLPAELSQFGRQLIADAAFYLPSTEDRPGGYLLRGVEKPINLSQIPSGTVDGKLAILSPKDTAWLQERECFVVSGMDFERLAANSDWQQYTSTVDLIAGLQNASLDYGADTRVLVHSRFVQPLLDMTLLFLGLPLVLGRTTRHIFVAAGHCMAVVAGFFVLILTSHALGSNYLISPATAAWVPAMILVPIATALSGPFRE